MFIRKKGINYHSNEAQVVDWLNFSLERMIINKPSKFISDGLWVGGVCELHNDKLLIKANLLNRSIHKNLKELEIPFEFVDSFEIEKKLTTDVIKVNFAGTFIRFRCWAAENFLHDIKMSFNEFLSNKT